LAVEIDNPTKRWMSFLEFRLGEIDRASGGLTERRMRNVSTLLLDSTPA
jgi:hypothetical protein